MMDAKDLILTGKTPVLTNNTERDSLDIDFLNDAENKIKKMRPLSSVKKV